jgi:AraC-like DNA-binding protein
MGHLANTASMPLISSTNRDGLRWAWYFDQVNALRLRRDPVARRLENARRFLDAHLDEPLTLDEIARRACLSKYHFLRVFKAAFHDTPIRYLRRRRLETAERLLVRTDLPVTDVCFNVGFESLGSFSSLFRRHAGLSPNAFRRRYVVVPRTIRAAERLIPGCWLRRYVVDSPASLQTQQF